MIVSLALASHKGKVRENNEDSFYFPLTGDISNSNESEKMIFIDNYDLEERVMLAVFDGMGGLHNGEFASGCAVESLKEIDSSNLSGTLSDYIVYINDYVCGKMRSIGKKIGSTAVLISFENGKYEMANVGDSRCYLYRDYVLEQISEDHTEAAALKKMQIDSDTFSKNVNHNWKNVLTQHLGISTEEFQIEPHVNSGAIRKDDIFLMCSDGLTSMVNDEEICAILSDDCSIADKRDELLKKALKNGGLDNITLILAHFL